MSPVHTSLPRADDARNASCVPDPNKELLGYDCQGCGLPFRLMSEPIMLNGGRLCLACACEALDARKVWL